MIFPPKKGDVSAMNTKTLKKFDSFSIIFGKSHDIIWKKDHPKMDWTIQVGEWW